MTSHSIADALNVRLKIARTELEELQKQFSQNDSSARDAYERVKKGFHQSINDVKNHASKSKNSFNDALGARIENMQIQVTLGKAQTEELFDEQKRKISRSLNEFDQFINSHNPSFNPFLLQAKDEVEKLRLKLDMLKIAYKEQKQGQNNITLKQEELNRILDQVSNRLDEGKARLTDNWENCNLILSDTYKELRKVFAREI
ncbi:MAG TPA: hypothetical protein PKM16_05260 [Bacteroidia bacterium]|nr:hypothetical protein [Bacteroidia bacterium]